MHKRAKVWYYDDIFNALPSSEFVCVGNGENAGRLAQVSNEFMGAQWKDTGEDLQKTFAYKFIPFVKVGIN